VGAAEIHGILAEGLVERVDRAVEAGATVLLGGLEQVGGVQIRGEQLMKNHTDLLRRLGVVGLRTAGPEFVQDMGEMDRVLGLVEAQVGAPVGVIAVADRNR